jgi:hypothetical protein
MLFILVAGINYASPNVGMVDDVATVSEVTYSDSHESVYLAVFSLEIKTDIVLDAVVVSKGALVEGYIGKVEWQERGSPKMNILISTNNLKERISLEKRHNTKLWRHRTSANKYSIVFDYLVINWYAQRSLIA